MSSPVPMPTARQALLHDRFKQYLSLEREGHPLEVLKAAKALVEEQGLNPYHAAHLHLKLVGIPEMGLYHATEAVRTLTQLRETSDSHTITCQLQEATNAMLEAEKIEKDWSEHLDTMTSECREAAVQQRFTEYFSSFEQEQSSPSGVETEDRNFMFDDIVKKGRTADSGGEKEEKEVEKVEDLSDDA
ncbi:hypothetical protein FPCIR_2792 [Fusarium pseudocircinatum]|uniref:Uncharacterized protein n=1 Tax=Fusarium pseudocircinatum TaxID=56676 RepID=A0A8H5UVD8_9HYPO|nr:hypothetical protein FPCIR_2792 [Fusarium pseudocircinatum]